LRDHWHGMSRTGNHVGAFGQQPDPELGMNAADMARLGLGDGDLVRVRSVRGQMILPVRRDPELQPLQTFVAMHWGAEFVGGLGGPDPVGGSVHRQGRALRDRRPLEPRSLGVNTVTTGMRCPQSQQPELKHSAVQIEPAGLAWSLVAMAAVPEACRLTLRAQLASLLDEFDFGYCVPLDGAHPGVHLRLAHRTAPAVARVAQLIDQLVELLGLAGEGRFNFSDPNGGNWRTVRTVPAAVAGPDAGDANAEVAPLRVSGFVLAGDIRSRAWLAPLLVQAVDVAAIRPRLLLPGLRSPAALADRGPQICQCKGVFARQIEAAGAELAGDEAQRLNKVQQQLGCGTVCGSCLPEVRRILRAEPAPV